MQHCPERRSEFLNTSLATRSSFFWSSPCSGASQEVQGSQGSTNATPRCSHCELQPTLHRLIPCLGDPKKRASAAVQNACISALRRLPAPRWHLYIAAARHAHHARQTCLQGEYHSGEQGV